jgi:hypothetical protein
MFSIPEGIPTRIAGHVSNCIRRSNHRHEDWHIILFASEKTNHQISRSLMKWLSTQSHFNPYAIMLICVPEGSHISKIAGPYVKLNPKTQSSIWSVTYLPTHFRRSQSLNISHFKEMNHCLSFQPICNKVDLCFRRNAYRQDCRAMCHIESEDPIIDMKIDIFSNSLPKKSIVKHLAL